tara:strand:- start:537 stop:653 length:117 start_codon:yes stop_codon:yes gene_type:complete
VTATRVPDNFNLKNDKAIDEMYKKDAKTKEKTLITGEY